MRCTVRSIQDDAHEECAWTCCWVPGGNGLVTGSGDETVKFWELSDDGLKLQKTFHGFAGHTLGVISVGVDPSGEWAASSALDSYVRVWSLREQNQERALLESMPTEVWSIAFGPMSDRCLIAAAGGTMGKVKLWDISSMQPGVKSPAPDPELLDVVCS
jgi:WD repeat-containing protein 61